MLTSINWRQHLSYLCVLRGPVSTVSRSHRTRRHITPSWCRLCQINGCVHHVVYSAVSDTWLRFQSNHEVRGRSSTLRKRGAAFCTAVSSSCSLIIPFAHFLSHFSLLSCPSSPLCVQLGGLGSVVSSSVGVWGSASVARAIWHIWRPGKAYVGKHLGFFVSLVCIPFGILFPMWELTVLLQEIGYVLLRHDVRGTVELVEKGCRPVSSCTPDMFLWSRGFCEGVECIRCIDNPATCKKPGGRF